MGDQNWDLSTGSWAALESGLTASGLRKVVDLDEETSRGRADVSDEALKGSDALWDRGTLY